MSAAPLPIAVLGVTVPDAERAALDAGLDDWVPFTPAVAHRAEGRRLRAVLITPALALRALRPRERERDAVERLIETAHRGAMLSRSKL